MPDPNLRPICPGDQVFVTVMRRAADGSAMESTVRADHAAGIVSLGWALDVAVGQIEQQERTAAAALKAGRTAFAKHVARERSVG